MAGRGKDQQAPRPVDRQIDGIERGVIDDRKALALRPSKDALELPVDKIQLALGIHRRARDGIEAAGQQFFELDTAFRWKWRKQ